MGARNYRDLIAWQKAMDLADAVYEVSGSWPQHQLFELTTQAQRAALSVPSNIAEGQGRGSRADFRRFLDIAHGSLCELETQLTMAHRRRFIDRATHDRLLDQSAEVGRLLNGLLRRLRSPAAG
jgi:four helix bundle protein